MGRINTKMTFNLKACQSNLFKIIAAKTKKNTNQADEGVEILYATRNGSMQAISVTLKEKH